jgi:hypothetical protein
MSDSTILEALEATLDPVRASVSTRVEQTSLRAVADEIGLSPAGLQKFLAGTEPYASTIRRLRNWYVRHAPPSPGLGLLDARAALNVLLHDVRPEARNGAALRMLAVVERGFDQSGRPRPPWLRELRAEFAAGSGGIPRPSALGKYRDLGRASEEFARAKQAEIDREDRSAA